MKEKERDRQRERQKRSLCNQLIYSDPSFANGCLEMFSTYNKGVIPMLNMEKRLNENFQHLLSI